jgi:hypothetical protein
MNVVFDTSLLLLLINPLAPPPPGPDGTANKEAARARINHLLDTLDQDGATVLLPTPALSELLIRSPLAASEIVESLTRQRSMVIAGFDTRAAIECGLLLSQRYGFGKRRRPKGMPAAAKTKVKFDHQIVAIARVAGAIAIYSDDEGVRTLAKFAGIPTYGVWDLPPPPPTQLDLLGSAAKRE